VPPLHSYRFDYAIMVNRFFTAPTDVKQLRESVDIASKLNRLQRRNQNSKLTMQRSVNPHPVSFEGFACQFGCKLAAVSTGLHECEPSS
jgi:hypothetical protein